MVMLDTNIILRYLLNDDEQMAFEAESAIKCANVQVNTEIFAEVVYVLKGVYHIEMEGDRKELMRSMCNLSQGIKEQGIKLGDLKRARKTAFSLAGRGMSAEDIADIVEVSTQTVQEWLSGADRVN